MATPMETIGCFGRGLQDVREEAKGMARILVVDDDAAITDLLSRVLARDGHAVDAANDPVSVLGLALSRYDLILCDVMMPGMDGFELVGRIRHLVDAPILFLTAKVAEEDAVFGLGLGADDYIRKRAFGWASDAGDDAISMHVSNARAKLRRANVDPIETVRGMGYKWQA